MDFDLIRGQYAAERPRYEKLAASVKDILESELSGRGLLCSVSSRAKDVASFVKKAFRKAYADPMSDIRDKAGVRVVAPYLHWVDEASGLIDSRFAVLKVEDKRTQLDVNQLGYLGRHFEVTLREIDLREGSKDLEGLVCEIQVHTSAESAWALVSHDLMYKPAAEPPPEVKRQIYRLVALVELFDEEVRRAKSAVVEMPHFTEARVLSVLERVFFSLVGRPYDRELSLRILDTVLRSYEEQELARFGELIEAFAGREEGKLRGVYERYRGDDRHVLLLQPEAIAVFERLEAKPMLLADEWQRSLPLNLLESLQDVWGSRP